MKIYDLFLKKMQFCNPNEISASCENLFHLSLCSSCIVSGSNILTCNGVVMTCVYGTVKGGSNNKPTESYYQTIGNNNLLIVMDASSSSTGTFTVNPSVDSYIVDQVYVDTSGLYGSWLKSMTTSTPSDFMVLYNNYYGADINVYTYYGLTTNTERKLIDDTSSLSNCESFSTYDCDMLKSLGICSVECPDMICDNNVITTCTDLVIQGGSIQYPSQASLTFESITDQITMILKSNQNINNSITMMLSDRSLSTVDLYNNSYYKSSFLLNPSYSSIFIENNSPNSQVATIIQTQFKNTIYNKIDDHLIDVWILMSLSIFLFISLLILLAKMFCDKKKDILITKEVRLSNV